MKFEIKIAKSSTDDIKMARAILTFCDNVEVFDTTIYNAQGQPAFFPVGTLRTDVRHAAEAELKKIKKEEEKVSQAIKQLKDDFFYIRGYYLNVEETEELYIISVEKAGA
jgi:hypothetical protein